MFRTRYRRTAEPLASGCVGSCGTDERAASQRRLPDADPAAEPEIHLSATLSPYFTGLVLDDARPLLEESYALRYQVYCHERRFLRAEDYPEQMEIDVFDPPFRPRRRGEHAGGAGRDGAAGRAAATRACLMLDHCTPVS